jgi:hypothetical protein
MLQDQVVMLDVAVGAAAAGKKFQAMPEVTASSGPAMLMPQCSAFGIVHDNNLPCDTEMQHTDADIGQRIIVLRLSCMQEMQAKMHNNRTNLR